MKTRMNKIMASVMALLFTAMLSVSADDTILQLFADRVETYQVENGVWTNLSDFANNSNSYGGHSYTFKGLASDGRRVFIGEQAAGASRILEFDMEGNFTRVFKYLDDDVEHMAISRDGNWLYVNIGGFDDVNACVHRYNAVTVEGGLFIPNHGTNALGETLWDFYKHRGVTEDENGVLWVSERENGTAYKFDSDDGSYLGKVTGMGGIQAMYYHDEDKQIYCTTSGGNSYIIDSTNDTRVLRQISGTGNRLGITRAANHYISAYYDNVAGDISAYDFDALTKTLLVTVSLQARELITLPATPLRAKIGELLISETVSNRVMRISFDEGNAYDVEDALFAGGEGVTYNGTPLREPRGLAACSNYVYVAEGVAGGRILKFSKWGTFRGVALDFSQTAFSGCVPAALAVTPDGSSLYVTDAHTIFIESGGGAWENVMTNGYLDVNTYGETVYKVNPSSHSASVFVNTSNLPVGNQLVEPRGIAVDDNGNVYFTSWYNDPDNLDDTAGRIYYYNPAGVMQAVISTGNPSSCYYDPVCVYDPPSVNTVTPGPGIVTCGFGIQDIFQSPAGTGMTTRPKIMDNSYWRTYIDVEVINEQVWYTDPAFGVLWLRTGYAARSAVLTDLTTPTYMTFAEVTGTEPPAEGTIIMIQ